MGVSFDGTTSPTRWLVVDIANDPLGHPNSEVGADPERPYASISIAHGIRRFEFMIHADESDEQAEDPAFVAKHAGRLCAAPGPGRRHPAPGVHPPLPDRRRRSASGRMLLAGDAAHLMPVWQGQGYNSGIRDAANLGWKLAAVVNGQADDALLDTYDVERRKHARAMIDLSTMVGRVISPTNRRVAAVRDMVDPRAPRSCPPLKRYVLEMRFKPMPRYEQGAVVHAVDAAAAPGSPVGTLFIQPRVDTREQQNVLLDDVSGPGSPCCAGTTTRASCSATKRSRAGRRWARSFIARPPADPAALEPGASTIPTSWSSATAPARSSPGSTPTRESVLFLRPDRCIAGACIAQLAPELQRRAVRRPHA